VEASLTIGEVARQVGLRSSALRYYEEAGVLPPPERLAGKRRYSPEVVDLLLLIRFCQRVGFSLAEVRELLAAPGGRRGKARWRELVDAKLTEVDALIEQAQAMKRVLEESRDCDCVTLESCSFLKDERLNAFGWPLRPALRAPPRPPTGDSRGRRRRAALAAHPATTG
jgi:MerR family transcriptional regulator, redox-sensitive transcriptional activator SoxR